MASQKSVEIRVGIFVLICMAVGAGLIWKFGKIGPSSGNRYPIIVTFDNVSGLIPEANVMYAGVAIGKVRAIKLDTGTKQRVAVILAINNDVSIRRDSKFVINQSGLLGDRYVDISPGTPTEPPLNPGDVIVGTTSVDLTEALRSVVEVLHQTGGTIERVNGMLVRIDGAVKRIDEVALNTQNLNHVSSILAQVDATTSNAVVLTANLRQLVDEGRGGISNTFGKFSLAADNVCASSRRVDEFVRVAQGDMTQITANISASAKRIDAILNRLEKGEGTAGKLLTDQALHDEMLRLIHNLNQYGLFYRTWLGPRIRTNAADNVQSRPSTLEPPPGGRVPVPARPAIKSSGGKP
jgi:phospholipid/cholesterol/gamma-HCH transport system substrate-binding protein